MLLPPGAVDKSHASLVTYEFSINKFTSMPIVSASTLRTLIFELIAYLLHGGALEMLIPPVLPL